MSRATFFRWFKAEMDTTLHQYLLNLRIEVARQSLAGTSFPIEKIADVCGFTDNFHMTRPFEQHLHRTPIQYRQKKKPATEAKR